jgi:ADP-ribose pyrophosphatase YjhB (NUDIX family)
MSSHSQESSPEPQHLIARAIIRRGASVLANRARNGRGEPYAALPGGHIDPGEDAKFALAREMEEELNAKIRVGDLAFVSEARYFGGKRGDKIRHEIVLFFEAELLHELPEADGRIASPEAQKNFGWVAPEEWDSLNLIPLALRPILNGEPVALYDFRDQTAPANTSGAE